MMQTEVNQAVPVEDSSLLPVVTAYQDYGHVDSSRYLYCYAFHEHVKYLHASNFNTLKDRLCSKVVAQYVPQFEMYPNTFEVENGKTVNLLSVIRIMKNGALKGRSEAILKAKLDGDIKLKKSLKDQLPYITHTGIFKPRRNSGLIQPAFTYQLDIDNVPNAEEVLDRITNDSELNLLFASKSPSGNGVKGMLFLKELIFLRDDWSHEQYSLAYSQATEILHTYFLQKHQVKIDCQMKAISQPFYLFHSPDMFIHKNLRLWV